MDRPASCNDKVIRAAAATSGLAKNQARSSLSLLRWRRRIHATAGALPQHAKVKVAAPMPCRPGVAARSTSVWLSDGKRLVLVPGLLAGPSPRPHRTGIWCTAAGSGDLFMISIPGINELSNPK